MSTFINAMRRIGSSTFSGLKGLLSTVFMFLVDPLLAIINLLTPKLRKGHVTPSGGKWPQHIAPGEGDSRSCCPALNALANHGILPHSGRGISFVELNKVVRENYNFAPTFCWYVPNYIAGVLGRDYSTGTFDLEDISVHNGIEHDASLTRQDTYFVPDQGQPDKELVEEVLSAGTGKNGFLTIKDVANLLAKRRAESRKTNGQYSQSLSHKIFGSSNSATLLTIFGGDPAVLKPLLLEERLPEGWEPVVRDRVGLTITKFNGTVLPVELSIDERKFASRK